MSRAQPRATASTPSPIATPAQPPSLTPWRDRGDAGGEGLLWMRESGACRFVGAGRVGIKQGTTPWRAGHSSNMARKPCGACLGSRGTICCTSSSATAAAAGYRCCAPPLALSAACLLPLPTESCSAGVTVSRESVPCPNASTLASRNWAPGKHPPWVEGIARLWVSPVLASAPAHSAGLAWELKGSAVAQLLSNKRRTA